MNIWIINPFDPLPGEAWREGRYAYLSAYLSGIGHHVTWWTSNFSHMTKTFRCSEGQSRIINDNYSIRLLPTPSYRNNVGFARLYNHFVFAQKLKAQSERAKSGPDIVLASFPPIESARMAVSMGRRLGAKVVIDVQDLWPEFFHIVFPKILRPLARMAMLPVERRANWVYRNADAIMGVSKEYMKRGLDESRKVRPGLLLHIGIDLKFFDDLYSRSNSMAAKDELLVSFTGTVGKSCDIRTILEAANLLSRKKSIKFVVAGGGPEYVYWKNRSIRAKASNVAFAGSLGYSDLVDLLKRTNVGLNAYSLVALGCSRTALQTFPNKVFDYLAAGLPIINSVPGEVEDILQARRAGITYKGGYAESLAGAIEFLADRPDLIKEMGKNARELVEEKYDRNKTYHAIGEFINEVLLG